jgi:alpha-tubulin suppressor-like RCC1 family protein
MTFLTAKFSTLSSFGFKFFLGLFVSFLLVGCGDENKISVAAGYMHSLTIGKDGNVYGAGYNDAGQLGLGNADCRAIIIYYCTSFTKVSSLEGKNITSVTGGDFHSFAIDNNGNVYGTGSNEAGQLGFGNHNDHNTFAKVSSLDGKNIIAISAGEDHSIALDSNGKVYTAGVSSRGQLGLGDTKYYNRFTEVSSLEGKNIIAITAGNSHSLAVDSGGKVYVAGYNEHGQLGLGDSGYGTNRYNFTEVLSLNGKNIIAVAAGADHSLALGSDGKVYATGYNHYGELGLGDNGYMTNRSSFTEVTSLNGKNIIAIAAGSSHSFALDSDGKVYGAGANSYGQLGLGDSGYGADRNTFTEVISLKSKNIIAITAGKIHSLAVDSNDKVYGTGVNSSGQLGLDDTNDRRIFTEVTR